MIHSVHVSPCVVFVILSQSCPFTVACTYIHVVVVLHVVVVRCTHIIYMYMYMFLYSSLCVCKCTSSTPTGGIECPHSKNNAFIGKTVNGHCHCTVCQVAMIDAHKHKLYILSPMMMHEMGNKMLQRTFYVLYMYILCCHGNDRFEYTTHQNYYNNGQFQLYNNICRYVAMRTFLGFLCCMCPTWLVRACHIDISDMAF